MKLTRVIVDGVGRFGTTARIEGLGPGVNILTAGNEAGKSTFFRAIRACLFERHTTKNDIVRNLATEGLSLPVTVTLGFDHEGKSYELSKSFLKSPAASLRRDGVEIARNREADESVWEILSISPNSGRSVDEAAFGILWVSQGQSFQVPEPSEAAASALNAAIQQEVGTLVGGERARQVLASVKADLSRQLTDSGRPRTGGALAEATRQTETIAADLLATEKRLVELDVGLEELARLRGEHKRLTDPVETARLKQEMDEATQQMKAGEDATAILLRCEEDERQAYALLKAQEERLDALRERSQRIDVNRSRSNELAAALAPLDEEEAAARSLLTENLARIDGFDRELTSLDDQDRLLQRMAVIAQRVSLRDGHSARLQALQGYEKRLALNEAALKANTVDEAAIRSLDEIERDMSALVARLEAGAAQLTVERRGTALVMVNGHAVEAGIVRAVTEPLSIVVGDMAAITVSPPQIGLVASQAQKGDLQQKLQKLLAKHGIATPAQMRQTRTDRASLEDEFRGLKAERAVLGLKDAPPVAEIARLATEIAQITTEHNRALADSGAEALPSPEAIESKRTGLQDIRSEARTKRFQCESVITGLTAILGRIGSKRGTLQGQLKEIEGQIATDLSNLPDDRRQEIIQVSEQEQANKSADHRTKAALLAEKRREAPVSDEIERRRNRVNRLRDALNNRATEIDTLNRRVANLEGQIQTAGGDGLGETVSDLCAIRDIAQAELSRQTARIETLQLLHEVVNRSYEKRREQLHAPLRRHLNPFLNDVFPQAEIELGDGFAVSGLRRNGPGSETFERLSAGTQEQIAVLVRLAMGAMICERGQEVPIILDDALVFSDDARIEQMFDALNRAGKKQQVIVLTCRTRTFSSLGGRQLSITSAAST